MRRIISFRNAAILCESIYAILILFHITIIVGAGLFEFIPIHIVWGGRMNTKEQLITFEIISLLIIMLCLFLTMIKSDHLKIRGLKVVSHYAMWLFFIYFLFNTITNLLAQTLFEKSMAILTIALSIGSLRLSIEKLPKTNKSDA